MSARGAVELIVAGIAMEAGLFSYPRPAPPEVKYLFSAVVIMALLTTLITPIVMRLTLGKNENHE
jgi:Kef-type K+ transport system membrane component KefB